jgi:hypothetical protein
VLISGDPITLLSFNSGPVSEAERSELVQAMLLQYERGEAR